VTVSKAVLMHIKNLFRTHLIIFKLQWYMEDAVKTLFDNKANL